MVVINKFIKNIIEHSNGKALKDSKEFHLPKVKSVMGQTIFKYTAAKDWPGATSLKKSTVVTARTLY